MKDLEQSERLLAESTNYYLIACYETVSLYRKSDDKKLCCVGHFYGDPEAALIDTNEKFCISVGCGYIVYRIREPYENYDYVMESDQWFEGGSHPDNTEWIIGAEQTGDNEVMLIRDDGSRRALQIEA
ncbi:MAG: hypothetical protein MJ153_09390 [Clostridia bacterium]|nr:hypothetical protein [Clostridia bacterium]